MENAAPSDAPREAARPLMAVELAPYRSLGRNGFRALMLVAGGASLIGSIVAIANGLWPVSGFFGLDMIALFVAFRVNYRRARAREYVHLTERLLTIDRVDLKGRGSRIELQPYWVRLVVEGDEDSPRHLRLRSHGRSIEVGSFLHPEVRARFAEELGAALRRLRGA